MICKCFQCERISFAQKQKINYPTKTDQRGSNVYHWLTEEVPVRIRYQNRVRKLIFFFAQTNMKKFANDTPIGANANIRSIWTSFEFCCFGKSLKQSVLMLKP